MLIEVREEVTHENVDENKWKTKVTYFGFEEFIA